MSEAVASNVSFHMVRDDLENYPKYELPPGYRFRMFREGDDMTWTNIHQSAEPFIRVTPELFVREYGENLDMLPERMFFVETESGEPAGSISAWWRGDRGDPNARGLIHWVVVHANHQRRGITKPMMTIAMQKLAENYTSAMLGTSSERIWAVKVYLDFGFYPDPVEMDTNQEVTAAWKRVQERLNHPLLAKSLK
jgi:GNAT superfamily N-acetyltransferase